MFTLLWRRQSQCITPTLDRYQQAAESAFRVGIATLIGIKAPPRRPLAELPQPARISSRHDSLEQQRSLLRWWDSGHGPLDHFAQFGQADPDRLREFPNLRRWLADQPGGHDPTQLAIAVVRTNGCSSITVQIHHPAAEAPAVPPALPT
jgi:hypothetical protein